MRDGQLVVGINDISISISISISIYISVYLVPSVNILENLERLSGHGLGLSDNKRDIGGASVFR